MRKYLKWWTMLPSTEKRELMQKYNITKILYSDIKMIYEKENVKF